MDGGSPDRGDGFPPLVDDRSGFAARLERWAADARVDEEARRRSHERWLVQQAEEEGTFLGALADLAERKAHVAVHTRSGGRHVGRVTVVGGDFAGVRRPTGAEVLIAVTSIASVRTQPDEPVTFGDRVVATPLSLAEVLVRLAAEREPVTVVHGPDEALRGALRTVGDDLVVLRLDGDTPAGTAYLPISAVTEVILGA